MFRRKPNDKPDWDADFEPLMKVLLSRRGVKVKSAIEVGRKKVDYFRGRDFKKVLLSSDELLKKRCPGALSKTLDGEVPSTDRDVHRLGAELIQKGFMYKAVRKPLNPATRAEDGSALKPKRWPDRLGRTPNQTFDDEGLYVVTYEGPGGLQHVLLALLIAAVLLVVLFPIWPVWAKIGTWYLSVVFLRSYFGVLILRMAVYATFWIAGADLWILPNINDEHCGLLDSFRLAYSWQRRKDGVFMLVVRFGVLVVVAVAVEQISQTTSSSDVQDFVRSSYIDVLDWGVEKLTALPASERQMVPSVDDLDEDDNITDAAAGDDDDNDTGNAEIVDEPPPKDDS